MISVSRKAVEKLEGAIGPGQERLLRVFLKGMGWGGPEMGLALDEPKTNDEKMEAEGLSFLLASDVADTIRSYGSLSIDYLDRPFFLKGFRLSLAGARSCWCRYGKEARNEQGESKGDRGEDRRPEGQVACPLGAAQPVAGIGDLGGGIGKGKEGSGGEVMPGMMALVKLSYMPSGPMRWRRL
jgi:Fe-S cluster assembly iron-binding protein IscA